MTEVSGLCFHLGSRLFCDDLRQADIFKNSESVQQHEILKNEAQLFIPHPGKFILLQAGNILVAQKDFPFIMGDEAGYTVKQSGFSAPGRSHNRYEFSLLHLK